MQAAGRDPVVDDLRCALDPIYWAKTVVEIELDEWQERVILSRSRFICLLASRQSGKTTVTSLKAAHLALYRPKTKILIITPSMRQTLNVFRVIEDAIYKTDKGQQRVEDNKTSLVLTNGSQISCVPASPDTIRGFSAIDLLIEDEAAFVDDAINDVITPMIDRVKGQMMLLSTPNGQQGHFFRAAEGGGDWERYEVTADDCPWISRDRIEQLRAEKGNNFVDQEYYCRFLSANDAVFPADQVHGAVVDVPVLEL